MNVKCKHECHAHTQACAVHALLPCRKPIDMSDPNAVATLQRCLDALNLKLSDWIEDADIRDLGQELQVLSQPQRRFSDGDNDDLGDL